MSDDEGVDLLKSPKPIRKAKSSSTEQLVSKDKSEEPKDGERTSKHEKLPPKEVPERQDSPDVAVPSSRMARASVDKARTRRPATPTKSVDGGLLKTSRMTPEQKVEAMLTTKVDELLDDEQLLLDIVLTIRTTVLGGPDVPPRGANDLTLDDFNEGQKYLISRKHSSDKRSEVKDYAPSVFYYLRRRSGISTESYLRSWSIKDFKKRAKEKSTGKSGADFIFSADRRYILKTLTFDEVQTVKKFLPFYFKHLQTSPGSLLYSMYGLHRLKHPRSGNAPGILYFCILENIFLEPVDERYDLKGSTAGRAATDEEKADPAVVLKDQDWEQRKRALQLQDTERALFLHQVLQDCTLLAEHDIMDYSLLIGIRKREKSNSSASTSEKEKDKEKEKEEPKAPQPDSKSSEAPAPQPALEKTRRKTSGKSGQPGSPPVSPSTGSSTAASPSSSTPNSPVNKPDDMKNVPSFLFFLESTKQEADRLKLKKPQRSQIEIFLTQPDAAPQHPDLQTKGLLSADGEEVYYLGIIDYFEKYNAKKKMAGLYKKLKAEHNPSTVAPLEYSKRFQQMAKQLFGKGTYMNIDTMKKGERRGSVTANPSPKVKTESISSDQYFANESQDETRRRGERRLNPRESDEKRNSGSGSGTGILRRGKESKKVPKDKEEGEAKTEEKKPDEKDTKEKEKEKEKDKKRTKRDEKIEDKKDEDKREGGKKDREDKKEEPKDKKDDRREKKKEKEKKEDESEELSPEPDDETKRKTKKVKYAKDSIRLRKGKLNKAFADDDEDDFTDDDSLTDPSSNSE